jgi:hypothetical protein
MRLENESKHAFNGYFVTLTYSEEFNDGELHKEHLQGFIKKLRNLEDYRRRKALTNIPRIKYFGVGEYGEQNTRPHYHLILFNIPALSQDRAVAFIQEGWEMGFTVVDDVNRTTIQYVCKYIFKQKYHNVKKQPPFRLMSTRPAIGANYLTTHPDYHLQGERFYTVDEGLKVHLPRYYSDRILDDEYKERRKEQAQEYADIQRLEDIQRDAKENVQRTTTRLILQEQKQKQFVKSMKRTKLN